MDKTNLELYKETGEPRYRELLIKEYAGLVKLLAAQLYAKTASYLLEQSDYESFGILGLLDAIEKYNPSLDVKFETYASHRIKGSIVDNLRTFDQIKRSTRDQQKRFKQFCIIAQDTYGPNYTRQQLLSVSKLSSKEFTNLEQLATLEEASSLDAILFSPDGDEYSFDILGHDSFNVCELNALQEDLHRILDLAMSKLTDRERDVIRMIYYEDMTIAEIALVLNVTESRISQIHRKALNKMKQSKEVNQWIVV